MCIRDRACQVKIPIIVVVANLVIFNPQSSRDVEPETQTYDATEPVMIVMIYVKPCFNFRTLILLCNLRAQKYAHKSFYTSKKEERKKFDNLLTINDSQCRCQNNF